MSTRRIVLTFGLISGLVMSAMLVLLLPLHDRIGDRVGMIIGYTSFLASSLVIYAGVRRYRDHVAGGAASFGRLLGVGLAIGATAGLLYTATWEVAFLKIGPQFLARMEAQQVQAAQARGASAAELARVRADAARFATMYRNPAINAALTFLEPLPVTLLAALLTAGLLRRRRDAGDAAPTLAPAP